MKNLNKVTLILAKILEVLCWLGTLVSAGLFLVSLFARGQLEELLRQSVSLARQGFTVGGLELVMTGGELSLSAITFSALAGLVLAGLYAMIFRNTYLILRTAQGKTWFSKGDTPFQKDIVRMLREIGIFLLSTCALDLIWSIGLRLILGVDGVELSVGLTRIILGLLVLCLSQFFDYGAHLQEDVDGLL